MKIGLICFLLMMMSFGLHAQEMNRELSLKGSWKFSIGDDPKWAGQNYNDEYWEEIYAPKPWEEQGFHGYDGFAWYRKTVVLSNYSEKLTYYLDLGYIDDVDEVYINGSLIGKSGNFPPDYTTAYNARRLYTIPHKLLHFTNKLTIAVRIFDEGGEGGIIHGDLAILSDSKTIITDLDLQGSWKFKTGDCGTVTTDSPDISNWKNIIVPGTWEEQGYKNYDGIACYGIKFDLEGQFAGERMVLMVGKIDDLDMVYVNGKLIGQSSDFVVETAKIRSQYYQVTRGYYIPPGVLNDYGENTIIVKVLDYWGAGGIWDGNVGLITQSNYIDYWKRNRDTGW